MRIGLITNHTAGKGLAVDAQLLGGLLTELGHDPFNVQFDQPCDEKFDLAISLETVNESFFAIAPRHVLIPNLEWFKPDQLRHAKKFDRIWAKTLDAERVLREKFPQVTYTGFLSRDRMDETVGRERKFLHVGGDSGLKNTNAVIAAWRQWRFWLGELDAPLTVISRAIQTDVFDTPGVTFLREVEDEELRRLQNSHLFHLQPSAYEGYGHALRESQSVGAVLLTTRSGPMGELRAPFEVDPVGERKVCLATAYSVSGREIRENVSLMLEQPSQQLAKYQVDARARWVGDYSASRERLNRALESFTRPVQVSSIVPSEPIAPRAIRTAVLGILGNFRAEFSTENDLAWTLNDMGYNRLCFQEDEIRTEHILQVCKDTGVNLLVYVHTHGWETPGNFSLEELWKRLKTEGIHTCSFHLDRYWGLNQLDRREDRIGEHAFWNTDRIFTADGGNQERFAALGIRHTWLQPGVSKRFCFRGDEREDLRIDVGFVGATGYHPEYPFRGQLIEFLRDTYGDRFRVFQGYRGKDLNDLYASVSVVVGDSCFGGSDFYWSDRVPETSGRGGFLLHPLCRGLGIPGVVYFTPGDLLELKDKIDWWLERPEMRNEMKNTAMEWVRTRESYHARMEFMLKSMGVA